MIVYFRMLTYYIFDCGGSESKVFPNLLTAGSSKKKKKVLCALFPMRGITIKVAYLLPVQYLGRIYMPIIIIFGMRWRSVVGIFFIKY